jgi:hypothetical protein
LSSERQDLPTAHDVPVFLDRFLDLFAAGDVVGLGELWDLPALVLGDEQVHGLMSRPHLNRLLAEAVFQPEPTLFTRTGPQHGSEEIESLEWISPRVAVVELPWPAGSAGGFLQGVQASTFLLRIDQHDQLKIRGLLLRGSGDSNR